MKGDGDKITRRESEKEKISKHKKLQRTCPQILPRRHHSRRAGNVARRGPGAHVGRDEEGVPETVVCRRPRGPQGEHAPRLPARLVAVVVDGRGVGVEQRLHAPGSKRALICRPRSSCRRRRVRVSAQTGEQIQTPGQQRRARGPLRVAQAGRAVGQRGGHEVQQDLGAGPEGGAPHVRRGRVKQTGEQLHKATGTLDGQALREGMRGERGEGKTSRKGNVELGQLRLRTGRMCKCTRNVCEAARTPPSASTASARSASLAESTSSSPSARTSAACSLPSTISQKSGSARKMSASSVATMGHCSGRLVRLRAKRLEMSSG